MAVRRAIAVGSHWKGTAVRRFSDHDLLVVFSRDEARKWAPSLKSTPLIGRVRRSIGESFPSTTLRIDKQAVCVAFEQGAHAVDVVPAVFDHFSEEHSAPIYTIPDGFGGWLTTAPDLHKKLIDDAHARSGRKLKSLVRMLKWWSSSRIATSRISSLYLEWFVIFCAIPVGHTYQEALAAVFEGMVRSRLPPFREPFGISSTALAPVKTNAQHVSALRIAARCARWAQDALAAETRGRFALANDRWSLIFNRKFPSNLR